MFQRLLVCTDLSDGLQRLTRFVPSLAANGIQKIVFLHTMLLSGDQVIPQVDEAEAQKIRDRLAVALQTVPSGVEVQIEVQWGKPVDRILSAVNTHQADLVILGTPTRSLLTEKLFGSTTIGLCQRCTTPVLIFRPQLLSAFTEEELDLRCRHLFRYLLIPYDGSKTADYLVQRLRFYAEQRPPASLQECLLTWTLNTASGRRDLPKVDQTGATQAKLDTVKASLEALNLKVSTEIRQGNPIQETLATAIERDISAIALSSGSLGKLIELSIPSFAGEILRRSWHPLIYFPPARG